MKTLGAAVLALVALTLTPMSAHAASDDDCANGVSTAEWSDLQVGLDDPIRGGARRSVIEEAWGVTSVGYRNEFWQPAGHKVYSYAYNFCQNPEVLIILVYRKSSGAWQYAIKGGLG